MENTQKRPMFWPGIKALLTVEKVFAIITIVSIGLQILWSIIEGTIYLALYMPRFIEEVEYLKQNYDNFEALYGAALQGYKLITLVYNLTVSTFNLILTLPLSIIALSFINIILRDYPQCQTKKEATRYGVLAIVAGFLGSAEFAYVAAVLIFIRKRSDFPGENIQEENKQEIPLLENKEEVVSQ